MADLEIDGFSVSSNQESEEDIRAAFTPTEAVEAETPAVSAEGAGTVEAPEKPADPSKPDDRNTDGTYKKKARTDPHARMLEATATAAEAKRERDEARAEAAAAKAERDALKAERERPAAPIQEQAKPVAVADDPEPDPKTYPGEDYDPKYLRDMARWSGRQEAKDFHAKQQESWRIQQAQRAESVRMQTYAEKVNAKIAQDPAFKDRMMSAFPLDMPIPRPLQDAIIDSAAAGDVLEYLIGNPDDFRRLATLQPDKMLSPQAIFREIGKIEAKLEARLDAASPTGPASKPLPISQAKAIPKPVKASPPVSDDDTDDADDLSEAAVLRHIKRENARDSRFNPSVVRR